MNFLMAAAFAVCRKSRGDFIRMNNTCSEVQLLIHWLKRSRTGPGNWDKLVFKDYLPESGLGDKWVLSLLGGPGFLIPHI